MHFQSHTPRSYASRKLPGMARNCHVFHPDGHSLGTVPPGGRVEDLPSDVGIWDPIDMGANAIFFGPIPSDAPPLKSSPRVGSDWAAPRLVATAPTIRGRRALLQPD